MLGEGRKRLIDEGAIGSLSLMPEIDAEQLPFRNNSFDCITIGFGLRNVTRKEQALAAMYRALKPRWPGDHSRIFPAGRAGSEAGL